MKTATKKPPCPATKEGVPAPLSTLKVFVQVRPEKPPQGWPMGAGGWVTLASMKSLGGWSLDLHPESLMTPKDGDVAIEDWMDAHKDPKTPWHYRVLYVQDMGMRPVPKKKRKAATKR